MIRDMSDEVISNVDVPMTGVSIKMPMFSGVAVLCTIGDITTTKGDDNIRQLQVPLIFEEATKTADGRDVTPGYKHVDRIDIDPRGNRKLDQCQKDLGWLQVAALGLADVKDPFVVGELIGKKVRVAFSIRQFKRRDGTMGEMQQCKYLRADR